MPNERQHRPEDYTVGIVCALPIELAAVETILDEYHTEIQGSNIYTLGSISGSVGKHNIVIVCLPDGQIGTISAAVAATQMRSDFPFIRFGLMIGVGGGVPSEETDIRLGDVVVSRPGNGNGGVIQYDFGKVTPDGFKRTGFLDGPPAILLTAVSRLKARDLKEDRKHLEYPPKFERLSDYKRGNTGPDLLFKAAYEHEGGDTCQQCSKVELEERLARDTEGITIHYGTIASGNQVIKDAIERDRLSSLFQDILCFEMEGAGLMNSFRCLVIRGICDYADSHKNKTWQPYAAGAAAAYAKELLSIIPEADVTKSRTIEESMQGNNRLTSHDIELLIRMAQAQEEIGQSKVQECRETIAKNRQLLSTAVSLFLVALYGLLAVWISTSRLSRLDTALVQIHSLRQSMKASSKKLLKELEKERSDRQDTINHLEGIEEQINHNAQGLGENSVLDNIRTGEEGPQISANGTLITHSTSGQELELDAKVRREVPEVRISLQLVNAEEDQVKPEMLAQVVHLEKMQDEAKRISDRSDKMAHWQKVWAWIAWGLKWIM